MFNIFFFLSGNFNRLLLIIITSRLLLFRKSKSTVILTEHHTVPTSIKGTQIFKRKEQKQKVLSTNKERLITDGRKIKHLRTLNINKKDSLTSYLKFKKADLTRAKQTLLKLREKFLF